MTKRDLSRMSIVAFVIGLICATLSSAEDAMTICQRIQSNDLKIRTMGLVGELFIVLTSEGHLFYLPKANLRDVDTSSTTLTIDHVPISAHRVFGVVLDYSARPSYLFFLLVDGQSKSELLLKLQVESKAVQLQAFHLDWSKNRKRQNLLWTKNRFKPKMKFDFNPVFVANGHNSLCAEAITTFVMHRPEYPNWRPPVSYPTHRICLSGDSLNVEWHEKEGKGESNRFTRVQEPILGGFSVSQPADDGPPMRFYLVKNGSLLYWNEATNKLKYHYQLRNFIRCGPSFMNNTQRWDPSQVTSSNGTHVAAFGDSVTDTDDQTDISGWIIGAAVLVSLAIIAILLVIVKKKREKMRIRGNKVSGKLRSKAASPIPSPNGGSSKVISGSSSSNASSGSPLVPPSAFSGFKDKKANENKMKEKGNKKL